MPILQQVTEPFDDSQCWLLKHQRDVTSQHGEDGIIEKIFEVIGDSDKWCVEFGAVDGKVFSNTYNLLMNKGWSGAMIEAQEEKFLELQQRYQSNPKVKCIKKYVQFAGENTLDNLLEKADVPQEFSLLSIDIDGNDYHVWDSLKAFQPKVVVIEINPTIPNDIIFIQDKSFEINHGSSLRAMIALGETKGYELVCATPSNGIFVDKRYFSLFGIDDNAIGRLYNQQPYATRMFQLYDGTLLTGGITHLFWHGTNFAPDELQILPRAMRRFPDRVEVS